MKKLLLIALLLSAYLSNAQAFSGKDDKKLQIGGNFQEFASGINASFDYGLAENISIGLSTSYALNVNERLEADFIDRYDIKARINANLGNVINISEKFDVYPGLSLSTKNFGGHLGLRYFFTNGFGVYSEFNTTLAKYDNEISAPEAIHNQFTVNIGATFNL
jgi:hypothetical protein